MYHPLFNTKAISKPVSGESRKRVAAETSEQLEAMAAAHVASSSSTSSAPSSSNLSSSHPLDSLRSVFEYCTLRDLRQVSSVSRDWCRAACETPEFKMFRLAAKMKDEKLKKTLSAIGNWRRVRVANTTDRAANLERLRDCLQGNNCFQVSFKLMAMMESAQVTRIDEVNGRARIRVQVPTQQANDSALTSSAPGIRSNEQVLLINWHLTEAALSQQYWTLRLTGDSKNLLEFREYITYKGCIDPIEFSVRRLVSWMKSHNLFPDDANPRQRFYLLQSFICALFRWVTEYSNIEEQFLESYGSASGVCAAAVEYKRKFGEDNDRSDSQVTSLTFDQLQLQ